MDNKTITQRINEIKRVYDYTQKQINNMTTVEQWEEYSVKRTTIKRDWERLSLEYKNFNLHNCLIFIEMGLELRKWNP